MALEVATLALRYLAEFDKVRTDRTNQEEEWLEDLRQYKGMYDAVTQTQLEKSPNRSKAFMRLTKVKVNTILSRLMGLLFPANGSRNWDIASTPKPVLRPDMMAAAIQSISPEKLQGMTDDEQILYISDRAMREMRTVISDQLVATVGRPTYKEVCRKVTFSGLLFGTGVLKGPLVETRSKERWEPINTNSPRMDAEGKPVDVYKWDLVTAKEESAWPYYEHVDIWSFYPDMSCDKIEDARYIWQEYLFTRAGLQDFTKASGFDEKVIARVIRDNPDGTATPRNYETRLKSLSKDNAGGPDLKDRYRVLERWGYVSGKDLTDMGLEGLSEEDQTKEYNANLWFLHDDVIKAVISPLKGTSWPYRLFSFDTDETSIFGEGVPSVMRHPQHIINAAVRMILDNSAIASGPMVGINAQALRGGEDPQDIHPWKVWLFDDIKDMKEAITFWQADPRVAEGMSMVKFFSDFADEVTAPRFMSGQGNVKGAGETAHGLSMLMGAANVNIQDLVGNFDAQITQPFIKGMYHWNMQFNPRDDIKGDFEVSASGSSALMAKEVRGPQLLQLAQITESDRFKGWVKDDVLLRELAENSDIRPERMLRSEAEKEAYDARNLKLAAQANIQAAMEAMTKQGIDPKQALMEILRQNMAASQQGGGGQGQQAGARSARPSAGPVRMPTPQRSNGQLDGQQMQEM